MIIRCLPCSVSFLFFLFFVLFCTLCVTFWPQECEPNITLQINTKASSSKSFVQKGFFIAVAHVVVCVCFGIFWSDIYFVLDSTWKLVPSSLNIKRRAACRLLKENWSSLLFILSLYHLIWPHMIIWMSHYAHKYNLLHPRTAVIVICDRLVGSSSCIRSPAAPVVCRLLYKADLKSLYHNGKHSIWCAPVALPD